MPVKKKTAKKAAAGKAAPLAEYRGKRDFTKTAEPEVAKAPVSRKEVDTSVATGRTMEAIAAES